MYWIGIAVGAAVASSIAIGGGAVGGLALCLSMGVL